MSTIRNNEPVMYQLEVPDDWCLWRGYNPDMGTYMSAMDWLFINEDALYDASAFFSIKPDIDVLGPPKRRSRSQRGWYQIIRAQGGKHGLVELDTTSFQCPVLRHSTASTFPAELLQIICDKVVMQAVNFDKSMAQLRRCALVCRDWRRRCHMKMFRNIVVHSRAELSRFLELANHPTSLLKEVPMDIQATPRVPNAVGPTKNKLEPWIHLLAKVRTTTFPLSSERIMADISIPYPRSQGPLRSIHWGLPRVCPSLSPDISCLELRYHRFRKLDDLLHLLWELPHLSRFKGHSLSWPAPNAVSTLWLQPKARRELVSMERRTSTEAHLVECAQNSSGFLISSMGDFYVPKKRCSRWAREVKTVGQMLATIETSLGKVVQVVSTQQASTDLPEPEIGRAPRFSMNAARVDHSVSKVKFYCPDVVGTAVREAGVPEPSCASVLTIEIEHELAKEDGTTLTPAVSDLVFHFDEWRLKKAWKVIDWAQVEDRTSEFEYLKIITFIFTLKEDAEEFVAYRASEVSNLLSANRQVLKIFGPPEGGQRWGANKEYTAA